VSAVSGEEMDTFVRETEKPKVLGCFSNNLFNKVDFPEPDGPEMTIGLATTIVSYISSKSYGYPAFYASVSPVSVGRNFKISRSGRAGTA
jgi:hypothetical protein